MLHLITSLYRHKYIQQVYCSISNAEDIRWHVAKSKDIITPELPIDSRIILHDCDCRDNDPVCKRDTALSTIKDGYFYILDDDTEFHPGMYTLYKLMEASLYEGMIIGKQINKDRSLRLKALSKPAHCYIDAGNVLCHHSAIPYVLKAHPYEKHIAPDFVLWDKAYSFFGNCKQTDEIISLYNSLV
jgi:hypothetical protein